MSHCTEHFEFSFGNLIQVLHSLYFKDWEGDQSQEGGGFLSVERSSRVVEKRIKRVVAYLGLHAR